jgi:hypothetical protein
VLVLASTGWWLERSLLNTGRFTDSANKLLDQPEVQTELTTLLVRRLSKQAGTDLRIAQPFLAAIVQQVVDGDAFRNVFDRGLSTAHRVLVDRDTESIVLDRTAEYEQIKGPLEQVAPKLASQLPSKQLLDVVLLHRSQLSTLWDVIDLVKRVVVILTVATIALLATGIALAVDRWRAVARACWVVVGSVVVLLLALLVVREVLVAQTAESTLTDAVRAAYRVLVRPLVVQSLAVGAIAALLAPAARFTAKRGLPAWRTAGVDAWAWLSGVVPGVRGVAGLRLPAPRENTRGTRAIRALVLVAIGVFAVLVADTLPDVVVVLIGLGLLYLAAIEVIAAWRAPSARDRPTISELHN